MSAIKVNVSNVTLSGMMLQPTTMALDETMRVNDKTDHFTLLLLNCHTRSDTNVSFEVILKQLHSLDDTELNNHS